MLTIEKEIKDIYIKILNNLGQEMLRKYKFKIISILILYIFLVFAFAIFIEPRSDNYFVSFSIFILIFLFIFLLAYKLQLKTIHSLGFEKKRDYIIYELRNDLVQRELFHSTLLNQIISSLDSKTTIKYSPALLISFLFFLFNPLWNYFLISQIEERINLSKIILSMLIPTVVIFIITFPLAIFPYLLRSTNKSLLPFLNELLYESIYKELNKNDYVYTSISTNTKKRKSL
ncbi:hypothetical protein IBB56_00645 [Listeria welshimeri]|uniref:Putative membrane protein n=1 Tax=Listeria welshimeri serovar 6b (strain ATCC 35897 / DSM 20650 / CCUG 15529 / CIP 8149 / NCTC 11857 / SLCC 5334 / V8) TaxID=386043 RepID=A0AER5_LISW6|nr:hypothetical protein [Listeria welshimeri]MBC1283466.1 hypothetical protein [Listeria welshimeri]MBC1413376.1 hypothetical protein [Listeria welshimeri]MBC1469562.1 hypothetical protein [Listeria welshimeri]MBC1602952.1 hypothetical protein [Listeria welshimeri]MBC1678418.1 hypothetical protein [Listeria welshimeri]